MSRTRRRWRHQWEGCAASCRTKVLAREPGIEVRLCSTHSFLAMSWCAGGQENVVLQRSLLARKQSFDCKAEVGRGMVWMERRRGIQDRMGGSDEEGVGSGSLGAMAWSMVMEVKGCGRGGVCESECANECGRDCASGSESEPGFLLRQARRWDQPFPSRVDA